jgi:H+-transporting ATPase
MPNNAPFNESFYINRIRSKQPIVGIAMTTEKNEQAHFVVSYLNTDQKAGLTTQEVKQRFALIGANVIEEKKTSSLIKLLSFFWGPIPWMIETAVVLSAALQRWEEFYTR